MSNKDILIAGAGPVGLTAALELARRGFHPRILDKGNGFTPIEQSRALAVNNRTLQLLEASGVTDALLAAGNQVRSFRIRNKKDRDVISLDFENSGALYPFILVVPQGETERLLAQALAGYGVEVEWNAEIIDSNADNEKPAVDINRPNGVDTIKPDILIGADGARSAVRKMFGFTFDGEGYPIEFGLADIETGDLYDPSQAVIHFSKRGTLGVIPIRHGLVRFISPTPDVAAVLPGELKKLNTVWESSFHISFRHVKKMRRGNIFLAGDAAHIHSPAGGRGMNLGIEDACWLAWMLAEDKAGEYSEARLPEVEKIIAYTKQQTNGLVHMNWAARWARDHLANSLLNIAPIKRAALTRLTGLDTTAPPWLD